MILHNDIDMPFAKQDAEPVYLTQMKALLKRHPKTSIIWAHFGLGRIVHPVQVSAEAAERNPNQLAIVEAMVTDPELNHVSFDISWDEVAKYAVATPSRSSASSTMLNKYPDRFLFGTDTVAPAGPGPVLCGLRHVGAALAAADARGEPQGAQGQLRADLRRGSTQGPRVGSSEREMKPCTSTTMLHGNLEVRNGWTCSEICLSGRACSVWGRSRWLTPSRAQSPADDPAGG